MNGATFDPLSSILIAPGKFQHLVIHEWQSDGIKRIGWRSITITDSSSYSISGSYLISLDGFWSRYKMAEGFQGLIKVDWIVTNATYDIAKANLLEAVKNAVVNWQRLIWSAKAFRFLSIFLQAFKSLKLVARSMWSSLAYKLVPTSNINRSIITIDLSFSKWAAIQRNRDRKRWMFCGWK